jgi:hypothetical protein
MVHASLADHFVGAIGPRHIPLDRRIDLTRAPTLLFTREALRLGVDGFEFAAVDSDHVGI